jgi:hypothetical protein
VSRLAVGTTHPRVVCDTKAIFVAAYHAAAGKPGKKTEEKAEAPVPLEALASPSVVTETVDEEIAALERAIAAKKAARIAELKAKLAAFEAE